MDIRPGRRTKLISPKRRVISGRVKNDAKAKLPKMSFRPCPSFINSNRKSIHCSNLKNNQMRKEVIKKMVWLTDHALSENKEISQSTPIKPYVGLTPNKSLRNRNYFLLPEFFKKKTNINELRTPLKEFVKRETSSFANIALSLMKNPNIIHNETSDLNNDDNDSNIIMLNFSNKNDAIEEIFKQLQQYNNQVEEVYDKLKSLDEIFRNNIKGLSHNEIYDKFQVYQVKKEKLYEEIKILEEKLKKVFDTRLNFGKTLKNYMENKEKLWEKRIELHEDFKSFIQESLEKIEGDSKSKETPKIITSSFVEEKPKLRRSLRLSKIPRPKVEERTPMSKRLRRIDVKSKGIVKHKE